MRAVIVCTSVSHGNTKRIADVMGRVLEARVVEPEQVDVAELAAYDLVGFGSGIFTQNVHPRLSRFVQSLPEGRYRKAFVFTTSGLPEPPFRPHTRSLVRLLERKGFDVSDTFQCRGYDTWLPFKLVGGIKKGRPDATDLEAARAFAEGLKARALS
ncbi:flavodoxin family protein [Streptomyces hesseae]|uniref:Flavodoxin family protein n=1 Tax=Streptomyces hesseae TaxID=3075519 RepID=A0ABU2SPS8_9ACTN|nr:flavodoxin family protein [Streptomyces sp. DSM 40473]MDT0451002.1 flavodoxin family protein [Streptomyces sp. DSM 40473]